MLENLPGSNLNWLELVWLIVTGVGLLFSVLGVAEAYRDLRAVVVVRGPGRGPRFLIAVINLRREFVLCLVEIVFVTIGLIAAYLPNRTDANGTGGIAQFVTGAGFIITAIAMTMDSILSRHERRDAIELWRNEQSRPPS